MKRLFLLLTFIFSILFYSCKKDTAVIDVGKNYFPLTAGSYIEYDVDSTYYNDFYIPTKVITTKFRLKEKIQSLYNDNQNRLTARLERYVKYYDASTPYDAIPWKLKDVWVENNTATTAEKVEENVRFIRLIFPVKVNKSWNMNNQNFLDAKDITYKSVDAADNIGGIAFSSVLQTVVDDGGGILTARNYFTEKYAREIGLVYKQEINVQSQPDPSANSTQLQLFYAIPIMQRITSGYQYTWTVHTYGVE
jgi:hypothetical protein